ncbi:Mechanosensitive ion channel-domain-containing protein [Flagelloscypha sp. PMI_526]|nr:Mechanosensitive ion channel-domain-containing protein [Flagelloscypha sp. PMI_526]
MPARGNVPPSLAPVSSGHLDVLATSGEEIDVASPPYASPHDLRAIASSSRLDIATDLPSPAYASRLNLGETLMDDNRKQTEELNEKAGIPSAGDDEKSSELEGNANPTLPRVHYPEHVQQRSGDMYGGGHSRPASIATTDTEDDLDEENYDWSTDEDLVDQEAKFEEHIGGTKKKTGWGPKRILTFLFSSLIGSMFLAGILVTPGVLLHFYYYKPLPTEHRKFIKDNVQAWLFWGAAQLLVSWFLAVIVDLIPIVVIGVIAIAWGHVSENVKSKQELYNSVKNTFKPVLYGAAGWLGWVIVFQGIYKLHSDDWTSSRAQYTNRVSQVIEFLFFFGLVVCAQKMLSHAIAFSFHRTAFKDRLEAVETTLKVIEKLRDYKPRPPSRTPGTRTPNTWSKSAFSGLTPFSEKSNLDYFSGALKQHKDRQDRDDVGHEADDERTVVGSTSKGKRKSWLKNSSRQTTLGSAAGQDTAMELGTLNVHRYPPSSRNTPRHSPEGSRRNSSDDVLATAAKAVKTAVLHDARNIKGDEPDAGAMLSWNVNSSSEAKNLARSIYARLKVPRRSYLLPEDFEPAFASVEEAHAGFRVFDKDNNGDLSRAEIKTTFLKMYKERRFLARSMRDVSAALVSLDRILLFFALVVLFFISLSVFGVEVGDSLTSVYSIGIAASFIFKNTASSAFDSIMFLFVTHPFDTGDRCFIDEENLVVKKMGLFATVFTRVDGTESYYFNSQLFQKFITNVRRSGKMYENCVLQVAWNTPLAKLEALESCLNSWLSTEENRWYEPATSLTIQRIDYQRYMEVTFPVGHNGTWQDWGMRCQRKSAFYAALHYYCHQLGIVAYEAPMPIVYGTNYDAAAGDDNGDENVGAGVRSQDDVDAPVTSDAAFVGADGKDIKNIFGFYPPETTRERLRARKSRKRKAAGGMGGGN